MRILYLDCFSGISGDMMIGALLDLGASEETLRTELEKLNLSSEYELIWKQIVKKGISSKKFDVLLKSEHDHSHNHFLSHDHHHGHDHHHDHHHGHEDHQSYDDHHSHNHHHIHDQHRHYTEIARLIENTDLNMTVKETALKIFEHIGKAEAKIHQMPLENVHFHEVGAIDSIIDIVGTAILIHQLDVEKVVASPVPVGNGSVHIDHGIYPVPAPATLELLKNIPIQSSKIVGEMTTPTGAGILAVIVDEFGPFPSMRVESIGYGAGTKDFLNHPNVLRAVIGTV